MSMKMQAIQLSTTWKLKILGVLAIGVACFLTGAECKRSACWRYGHVCWGGHGKRSGQTPVIPFSGSSEAVDGSDLYSPQWSSLERDRPWKFSPKITLPRSNKPQKIITQPFNLLDNSNGKDRVLLMQQQQRSPAHVVLTRVLSPIMFEQNARRINRQIEAENRNALDDALVIPDSSTKGSSSHEILSVPRAPLSAALKRSAMEDALANSNGGGTEEPLETSANGLDSGSVATFFRDRKSSGKTTTTKLSGNKRYSNLQSGSKDSMIDFPRQVQFDNIIDLLPSSQYQSNKNNFPKTRVYY